MQTPRYVELTIPGAGGDRSLPFVVGVLADLSGGDRSRLTGLHSRPILDVTTETLDACLPPQTPDATRLSLHYLLRHVEACPGARLRLLDVSWHELERDLTRAVKVDQSLLFRRIHDEIYGVAGADPFSLLVGDFAFDPSKGAMAVLNGLSEVAEGSFTPFLAQVDPAMFGLGSFPDLWSSRPAKLSAAIDDVARLGWRQFRLRPSARYVGLTLPRVRLTESPDPVWGNGAFVLASCVLDSFRKFRWPAAIRGVEGGGMVNDLPAATFIAPTGERFEACVTEAPIDERQEHLLDTLGFIPLTAGKNMGAAVFFSVNSCHDPGSGSSPEQRWQERVRSHLPFVMASSRIAQYLKAQIASMWDRKPEDCVRVLDAWLHRYVDTGRSPTASVCPLRSGSAHLATRDGFAIASIQYEMSFQCEDTIPVSIELPLPNT